MQLGLHFCKAFPDLSWSPLETTSLWWSLMAEDNMLLYARSSGRDGELLFRNGLALHGALLIMLFLCLWAQRAWAWADCCLMVFHWGISDFRGCNSGTIREVSSDLCMMTASTPESGSLQGAPMDISTVLLQNNNFLIHIFLCGCG